LFLPRRKPTEVDARNFHRIAAVVGAVARCTALCGLGAKSCTIKNAGEISEDPNLLKFARLTGLGLVSIYRLACAIGDIGRFANPKKLVACLGLNPASAKAEIGKAREPSNVMVAVPSVACSTYHLATEIGSAKDKAAVGPPSDGQDGKSAVSGVDSDLPNAAWRHSVPHGRLRQRIMPSWLARAGQIDLPSPRCCFSLERTGAFQKHPKSIPLSSPGLQNS
jgi:hypothetical protein